MRITDTAVSLVVPDPAASARFLVDHYGFAEVMSAPGFSSLAREDAGVHVVYLAPGLETMPPEQRDVLAQGLILAFVVEDLEGELARLQSGGVEITMPLTVEEWGERAFQTRDPNGVVVQLVDWNGPGATMAG
ncbi:VOC family protein [Actinomycetospora sp. OC33-EN08]|uniref:VOC family protein n=1 Tax=Actinomycetospora aurantiaca TaxID=3129233 RepID=A0ABU8MLY8_9PSEU